MVVVSMAFIGIIVGALLTAAGYAYRMKMQDLNARDNFYYVEHAMEEIYAGVGSQTVSDMQDAYVYTVEHMVSYDVDTQTYVAKSDEEAEKDFTKKFMENISGNNYFSEANLANTLSGYITDSTVKLDASKLYIKRDYAADDAGNLVLDKITIKNVTVTRTVQYDKSIANGDYTQTISADIEIGNPDFKVLFNTTQNKQSNLFDFAMVADMGVEINQTNPIVISGNLYAASDYYNKMYNDAQYRNLTNYSKYISDNTDKFKAITEDKNHYENGGLEYNHNRVSSKTYAEDSTSKYYNAYSTLSLPTGTYDYFDGINERSKYSGLYINRGNVSILADEIIVPGTVAVMNRGTLNVYGKSGNAVSEAEIWTDDIVLGGYSSMVPAADDDDEPTYIGPEANLRANIYVKDDTELNASNSSFILNGSYYGYGDSTEKDDRIFGPAVNPELFQVTTKNSEGTDVIENRGHYNSSAIIVNGERSTLNLQNTKNIYLAGRSYIELSRYVTSTDDEEPLTTTSPEYMSGDRNKETTIINRQTVEYNPTTTATKGGSDTADTVFVRDYKTGESISLKTNQLAYIPVQFTGIPTPERDLLDMINLYDDEGYYYYSANLHPALRGSDLFNEYFPSARFLDTSDKYNIPCIMQEVSGKKYYYYDFERAYRYIANGTTWLSTSYINDFKQKYPTAEDYAAAFIKDYVAELNDNNSTIAEYLTDIRDYENFEAGNILLPDTAINTNSKLYSTGAITTKAGTQFDVIVNGIDLGTLFNSTAYGGTAGLAADFSDNLDDEYNFIKWNLGHAETADETAEMSYIKSMVDSDYASYITPINKFMNFDKLETNEVKLNLSSNYYVVTSRNDVTINKSGDVSGIIITMGDVYFGADVTSFQGLIVSGGKIYINNNLQTMSASAEICRTVLRECQMSQDEDCKYFLSLFKGYENTQLKPIDETDTDVKTIDNIDYSDVCKFTNWMKNVE